MTTQDSHLPWKRYWCPTTGRIVLTDRGFLQEPGSEIAKLLGSDVVSFEALAGTPCLVLLGEPGIGKTSALNHEVAVLGTNLSRSGDAYIFCDLRNYGSEDRLVHTIFDDPKFNTWLQGTHTLHLLLDSLDECLIRIGNVSSLLLDEMRQRKVDVQRLRFRIACRTMEWPGSLERGLRELWGDKAVGVYEMAPLTETDVRTAAQSFNIDEDAFLHEIARVRTAPLAIKPVTLFLLLRSFSVEKRLPSGQAELYLAGCRLLCEETSETRRAAGLHGQMDPDKRLAIARRLAAISVFCNRSAIHTGVGDTPLPDSDVPMRSLAGGTETVNGITFDVGENEVREAFATGLFSSRGAERMGWAHQTYAEYLAASYTAMNMDPTQAISLVMHSGGVARQVVPQLHETAAWLAGMRSEVWDEVLIHDPIVLLRSDVTAASEVTRAALVASLLHGLDVGLWVDAGPDLRHTYKNLCHADLAEQLRPYITDRSKGWLVRRFAIDVAESCTLQTLSAELVHISLDEEDDDHVRAQAAHAVATFCDAEARSRLLLLAEGRAGANPDDELKGCGLWGIWPGGIPTEQMFQLLTPPKNLNLMGMYGLFLDRVPGHLTTADLPVALRWVEQQQYHPMEVGPFFRLGDEIIALAWDQLRACPDLVQPLARVVLDRLGQHGHLIRPVSPLGDQPLWSAEHPSRRLLLAAAVPLLGGPGVHAVNLVFGASALAVPDDIPWIIDQIRAQPTPTIRTHWVSLIELMLGRKPEHLDAVLGAMDVPEVAERLGSRFAAVPLGSPEAAAMKAAYAEYQELDQRPPPAQQLDPSPVVRVDERLTRCESGRHDEWWILNLELTLGPMSTHYSNPFESDLTRLPGWEAATSETRQRITAAARPYLIDGDPRTDSWLGTNQFDHRAGAGYRALLLLWREDPEFVRGLSDQIWAKWAPIVIAFPMEGEMVSGSADWSLIRASYDRAPNTVLDVILQIIDADNRRGEHLFCLRRITPCLDEKMMAALAEKLRDPGLKVECMGDLLALLLQHGSKEAKTFAASLVGLPHPQDPTARVRARQAAVALMSHAEDAGWSVVWPAVQADEPWGEEVLLRVSPHQMMGAAALDTKLTEGDLADLYLWLARRFPPDEDPVYRDGKAHFVSDRESVAALRDRMLNALRERGTPQAVSEIERLISELPGASHLKWTHVTAVERALRRAWVPPPPAQVLMLARRSESRLVESGSQLLDVIIESVRRWEAKLQGSPPAAPQLWNQLPDGRWRPKDEEHLSDALTLHLRDDLALRGVVINREVQIRPGEKPGGQGERTDVYVNAIKHSGPNGLNDVITAITEVKGCWHREVRTAMATQLVGRYLKDNPGQHGLYLVLWFGCPQWDQEDSRRDQVPTPTANDLQAHLDRQASELSTSQALVRAVVLNAALR